MKVESISIRNFKLFDKLEVSFKNKTLEEISNRFLVLGDNGAGKTTLLQAIALPLALATRQIRSVDEFDWIGFVPGRFLRWGPPRIELVVSFTNDEIEATRVIAHRWYEAQSEDFRIGHPYIERGNNARVRLVMEGQYCHADTHAEYRQFEGRYLAQQLLKTDPTIRSEFSQLPGLFWFDQFRNLGSSMYAFEGNGNGEHEGSGRIAYDFGVARLQKYLNGWQLAQLSSGRSFVVDYLEQLKTLYKRVFPNRTFAGVEPMPGVDSPTAEDFYFLFNDGRRLYDLVEMSAGEQAVFPILYEFVRQQISNSVVLIDEVDLNLHPPAAQLLVSQLPKIGPTCQFILTTHSDAVSSLIGDDETLRLPGGSLCL
ncbi:MAG: AAA family ATPase [Chloroflexi bacterium]|nr:AAA family ATPase [Chloroflexota bacterium]